MQSVRIGPRMDSRFVIAALPVSMLSVGAKQENLILTKPVTYIQHNKPATSIEHNLQSTNSHKIWGRPVLTIVLLLLFLLFKKAKAKQLPGLPLPN